MPLHEASLLGGNSQGSPFRHAVQWLADLESGKFGKEEHTEHFRRKILEREDIAVLTAASSYNENTGNVLSRKEKDTLIEVAIKSKLIENPSRNKSSNTLGGSQQDGKPCHFHQTAATEAAVRVYSPVNGDTETIPQDHIYKILKKANKYPIRESQPSTRREHEMRQIKQSRTKRTSTTADTNSAHCLESSSKLGPPDVFSSQNCLSDTISAQENTNNLLQRSALNIMTSFGAPDALEIPANFGSARTQDKRKASDKTRSHSKSPEAPSAKLSKQCRASSKTKKPVYSNPAFAECPDVIMEIPRNPHGKNVMKSRSIINRTNTNQDASVELKKKIAETADLYNAVTLQERRLHEELHTSLKVAQESLPARYLFEHQLYSSALSKSVQSIERVLNRFANGLLDSAWRKWKVVVENFQQKEAANAALTLQRWIRGCWGRRFAAAKKKSVEKALWTLRETRRTRVDMRHAKCRVIQNAFRSYMQRLAQSKEILRQNAAVIIQRHYRRVHSKVILIALRARRQFCEENARLIQRNFRGYLCRLSLRKEFRIQRHKELTRALESSSRSAIKFMLLRDGAARKIQAWYRRTIQRQRQSMTFRQWRAALKIQRIYRRMLTRRRLAVQITRKHRAATQLQVWYRCQRQRQNDRANGLITGVGKLIEASSRSIVEPEIVARDKRSFRNKTIGIWRGGADKFRKVFLNSTPFPETRQGSDRERSLDLQTDKNVIDGMRLRNKELNTSKASEQNSSSELLTTKPDSPPDWLASKAASPVLQERTEHLALVLQKLWRGRKVREQLCDYRAKKRQLNASKKLQAWWRFQKEKQAVRRLQLRLFSLYHDLKEAEEKNRSEAATRLSAALRALHFRRQYRRVKEAKTRWNAGAVKIQRWIRISLLSERRALSLLAKQRQTVEEIASARANENAWKLVCSRTLVAISLMTPGTNVSEKDTATHNLAPPYLLAAFLAFPSFDFLKSSQLFQSCVSALGLPMSNASTYSADMTARSSLTSLAASSGSEVKPLSFPHRGVLPPRQTNAPMITSAESQQTSVSSPNHEVQANEPCLKGNPVGTSTSSASETSSGPPSADLVTGCNMSRLGASISETMTKIEHNDDSIATNSGIEEDRNKESSGAGQRPDKYAQFVRSLLIPLQSKRSHPQSTDFFPFFPVVQLIFAYYSGGESQLDNTKFLRMVRDAPGLLCKRFNESDADIIFTAVRDKVITRGSSNNVVQQKKALAINYAEFVIALQKIGSRFSPSSDSNNSGRIALSNYRHAPTNIDKEKKRVWCLSAEASPAHPMSPAVQLVMDRLLKAEWSRTHCLPNLLDRVAGYWMHQKALVLQRVIKGRRGQRLFNILQQAKRREEKRLRRQRAAIAIQCNYRREIARRQMVAMLRQTYRKYVDMAANGQTYWGNPVTGYTTWKKPWALASRGIDIDENVVILAAPSDECIVKCEQCKESIAVYYCESCDRLVCRQCCESSLNGHLQPSCGEIGQPVRQMVEYTSEDRKKARTAAQPVAMKHSLVPCLVCTQCNYQTASRLCKDCSELYCDSCFAAAHQYGSLAKHTYEAQLKLCSHCSHRRAVRKYCGACQYDDHVEPYEFCDPCYVLRHNNYWGQQPEHRAKAMRVRLLPIDHTGPTSIQAQVSISPTWNTVPGLST